MKNPLIVFVFFLSIFAYSYPTEEEKCNLRPVKTGESKELLKITTEIDRAKEKGDIELFKSLIKEYHKINPPENFDAVNGPQCENLWNTEVKSRWHADDILIDTLDNVQNASIDSRDDSLLYIAISRFNSSIDVYDIKMYYSADKGYSWNDLTRLFWYAHHLYSPSMKVVETPDTDYVFVSFYAVDTLDSEVDVLVYKRNLVSGDYVYKYVATQPGVSEIHQSMDSDDIQYTSSPYLYLTFRASDSLQFIRSQDLGETWINRTTIAYSSGGYRYDYPDIAYGWHDNADSFDIGVVWEYVETGGLDRRIRFRHNHLYGNPTGWLPVKFFSTPTDHYDHWPSVKLTHNSMPSAVIAFARRDTVGTDQEDLYIYYTYDGARSWSSATYLYHGGDYEMSLDVTVDDDPIDHHLFFTGDNADVRYKRASYDNLGSGGWSTSIGLSGYGQVYYSNQIAAATITNQPCVCWERFNYGTNILAFDAEWLQTGIQDEPTMGSPLKLSSDFLDSKITLDYVVEEEGPINISVYDVSGRKIKQLIDKYLNRGNYSTTFDTESFKSGIFFIRMKTSKGIYSLKATKL